MNQNISKLIQERFTRLPTNIKHLITGGPLEQVESELANTFNLNQQQRTALSNEVTMTLLFFEPLSTFSQRLQTALAVDSTTTEDISNQLYTKIFKPDEQLFIAFSLQQSSTSADSTTTTESQAESHSTPAAPTPPPPRQDNPNPGSAVGTAPTTPQGSAPVPPNPPSGGVSQFRTMAEDMKAEQGESVTPSLSQEDLLKRN
jgi:hypothetical protein